MKILRIYSIIVSVLIVFVIWKALEYRKSANNFLSKYEFYVDHFGQRDRFIFENETLRSDRIVDNRIVFIGSQVINHWDLHYSFEGYETINRGIEHQLAPAMLLRYSSDVLKLKPQYVVIEVSSYNFRPNYEMGQLIESTEAMALLARSQQIEPIITTIIPPRSDITFDPDCLECPDYAILDSIDIYNQTIKSFAAENNFALSDWNNLLANPSGFFYENYAASVIEPNEQGYEILSLDILRIISGSEPD